ncbi:MAG TPA: DUF177 domain-containing protein [Deltaproteobacteria bacterium]|nr:DUF177 domain-containing protein [Deltaproteobacteria bacterium]
METMSRIEDIRIIPDTIGEAGLEKDISVAPEVMEKIFNNEDLKVRSPFTIHYVIEREMESEKIHATVDVAGELTTFCSRCLGPMKYEVLLNLSTDYLPASPDMSEHLEEERISGETGYYRRSILLGEYIISEMVLSLPMRYICSPDCKGLCPHCGVNLNTETCMCEKLPDPRLQKLAELKEKIRR